MDTYRPIKLHWMHGEAFHPREIGDHILPAEGSTIQIFKTSERVAGCRLQTEGNRGAKDVIALIHWDTWAVILEPRVANVTVAANFSQEHNIRNPSPVNVSPNPYYPGPNRVFLRPDDTIEFCDQHLTINIMFAEDTTLKVDTESSVADNNDVASEVQVKSSHVEPERATIPSAEDASDTEDEDDLDQPLTARSDQALGAVETTPVPTRPAEVAIKETPSNIRSYSSITNEMYESYSTARDNLPEDTTYASGGNQILDGSAESPSVRAQLRSNLDDSQLQAGEDLARTVDSTPSDPIEDSDRSMQPDIGIIDNDHRSDGGIYQGLVQHEEASGTLDLLDTDAPDAIPAHPDGSENSEVLESGRIVVPTSEPLDEHEVATKVAARTISQGSFKRKQSEEDTEAERHANEVTTKKQKFDEASRTVEASFRERSDTDDGDEDEDDEDDEDSRQSLTPALKDTMKGLENGKRSTRRRTLASTQESAEEIAVAAKKSSPEVVVKKPRVSSTPHSSATPSGIVGKVPKVLLSSDSAVQKTPAVKKWLKNTGAAIIDNVPSKGTHFVCVVTKEHSLKSAKVLHSLAMGKLVVTDDWITDSKVANELLDPAEFVHKSLEESITHDRSRLFSGKHLFFTKGLVTNYKGGWADIQEVAKAAGAIEVDKVPFNRPTLLADSTNVGFFGGEKGDSDISALINEHGCTVYSKELFTHSIISGELVLDDDEYKLTGSPSGKRRRS